jgi:hypothetical protein
MLAGDSHLTLTVSGQRGSNYHDWICEDGAFRGVLCNSQVINTSFYTLYGDGSWASGLVEANGGNANQPHEGDTGIEWRGSVCLVTYGAPA